jgi:hypothetical protein
MQCDECEIDYPDALVNAFHSSDAGPQLLCGICALAASNRSMGWNRKRFDGKQAERMRLAAIRFRKAKDSTSKL